VSDQVSNLEHDIEQTRARLAATIDQLVYRTSPKTIVRREIAAVKGYFVDPDGGGPRTQNIAKFAGAVLGTVALVVVVRKIVT
jgi:hypothetical protein